MSNKANFKLTKIYGDGSTDEPKIYKIEDLPDDWKFDRRSFMTFSGIIAGSFITLPVIGNSFINRNSSEMKLPDDCQGIKAHNGTSLKICFSPNSRLLLTTSTDNKLKLWQIPSFKLLDSFKQNISINSFAFAKSNDIITICNDNNVSFFNINSKSETNVISNKNILTVDYSFDGLLLALFSKTGNIALLDNKFEKLNDIETSFSMQFPIAFDIKNNYLLTSNSKNELVLYTIDFINEYMVQQKNSIVISKIGKYMLGFSLDNSIKTWELPIGNLEKKFICKDKITTVEISSNGDYIIAGTEIGTIYIYSILNDFKKIINHDAKITSLSFSPDNNYLASASDDGVIKLWEMPAFNHLTCLFDKNILSSSIKVNQYTTKNKFGESVTYTLPCGSPIPSGAVCVCNCVPGSACSCVGHSSCGCVGYSSGSYCQCNQICTCVPIK